MTRRSNGEGSFYQQKDKSWVYQVTYGRKEDGSPYRKAFKGRTKTICKERRAQWEEEQARIKAEEEAQAAESARLEELRAKLGHHIESEILFSEAFLKWLELYKSPPARKPSTYASYLDTYRIHFAEAFGNLPLYQITQDTIQDYYQRKQKNGGRLDGRKGGLSAKTIQNQHMLLKDFFAYAMRKYQLPCNPTVDTTRPEVITPEMRVLSPSEMQVFIEEVMRETQRVAILTTLFVGFRVGEVLALKISDLDLEKQTLSVTKNLIRGQVIGYIGTVPLTAGMLSMVTLMIKGIYSVLAAYLLIATTSIEKICYALRLLHIPAILVTQVLLTYRYVTVLLEEANRMTQAYSLRAPNQKGVQFIISFMRALKINPSVYFSMVRQTSYQQRIILPWPDHTVKTILHVFPNIVICITHHTKYNTYAFLYFFIR